MTGMTHFHRTSRSLLWEAFLSGSAASILSATALALTGRREVASAATPLNGPSQWLFGVQAPYCDGFSPKYTLPGYGIHHLASVFWGAIYEGARAWLRPKRAAEVVALGAATAATAALVDFTLTPQRLRPGFEKRLSARSLVLVYGAFAAGLAAATLASRLAGRTRD